MKHSAHRGIAELVVTLDYKRNVIKRYFLDAIGLDGTLSVFLTDRRVERRTAASEDWAVSLVEAGLETVTGRRLRDARAQ